jgi:transcriptional regulator with XRE-family HTH domain
MRTPFAIGPLLVRSLVWLSAALAIAYRTEQADVRGAGMISPYVRRQRLASELRKLRIGAGLTHEQLAKRIGQSRAQISRLENGHVADQDDVMRILDALGVDDERWTQIMTFAREAGERGWWESNKNMGERQALYANLEAGAQTIREFAMTFVPGLLQTEEFTRFRTEAEGSQGDIDWVAAKVIEARAGRQRMLRRPGGPTYDVILDELAVRRIAAPEEVVKAQLYHITATVNGNTRMRLRVLPVDARVEGYVVPRSAFSIYTFSDPGDPTIVAVDTVTKDLLVAEEEPSKQYVRIFEALWDASYSQADSLELLLAGTQAIEPPRKVRRP